MLVFLVFPPATGEEDMLTEAAEGHYHDLSRVVVFARRKFSLTKFTRNLGHFKSRRDL